MQCKRSLEDIVVFPDEQLTKMTWHSIDQQLKKTETLLMSSYEVLSMCRNTSKWSGDRAPKVRNPPHFSVLSWQLVVP